jgi:hypothetical protein
LGLCYQITNNISDQGATTPNNITKTIHNHKSITEKNVILNNTEQLHHPDQPGTASSPIESDIAGIATHSVAPSVYPSNGDSKGTDIHSSKGGRSVQFNGTNFYITICYNEEDINYVKSLKGYWQSKIRKWIIKATSENLDCLQRKYAFWDHHDYDKIKGIILSYECPYLVTLYRSPEMAEIAIVEISGYKASTRIIKSTTERCYQKDEKRWTIPNDQVIIDTLIADYTRDGAQIVNRLPQEGFDYNKKTESYGQFKTRYLLNTEA